MTLEHQIQQLLPVNSDGCDWCQKCEEVAPAPLVAHLTESAESLQSLSPGQASAFTQLFQISER